MCECVHVRFSGGCEVHARSECVCVCVCVRCVSDVSESALLFLNLPGWLVSEQGEVGSRDVGVLPPRTRDMGCLSEEVAVAFTPLSGNRADTDPERCQEQSLSVPRGHTHWPSSPQFIP